MKVLDYNSFINQDGQKVQSVNEHLWSGIIHRSETGEERKEDKIFTKEDIQRKIQEIIDETHPNEGDTIDLNHLDVSRVEDMSDLFYDLKNHINFTDYNFNVSRWDVSNVKDMIGMFDSCKYFNCDLSKWDVSNVKDMSFMFAYCEEFNSDLSSWDVSNVNNMKYMFDGCEKFKGDLSRWNVSSVTNMHSMFDGCEKFNGDLSRWDVSNVKDMRSMFLYCSSLKKIPDWYHL